MCPGKTVSTQVRDINFNATSMSPRWKANIPNSCRTDASARGAVADVIPINFCFVIAMPLPPFDKPTKLTRRCAMQATRGMRVLQGLQVNEGRDRPTSYSVRFMARPRPVADRNRVAPHKRTAAVITWWPTVRTVWPSMNG
jgi:hypothetical protein